MAATASETMARNEWKGVQNALAAIQKLHLRALQDVDSLDVRHKTHVDALKRQIKRLQIQPTDISPIEKESGIRE